MLFAGIDLGTRNSAAAFLDDKRGKLKHLSYGGGGVHTSHLPFIRTALQMFGTTVEKLYGHGLSSCSLANAKKKMGKTWSEWYAFLDEIVEGCLFELDQDTAEALMVDGWKYDLAGSSLELISDHAFRAKRHVQEGKTTFELRGQDTVYVYPCFLHTLFVRYLLCKMVKEAGLSKANEDFGSLASFFQTVTVTVPNAYDEHTKEEVKDILEAAGVPKAKVTILNESLAGMIGYIHLNLEQLQGLIDEARRPITVCNLDCGSQTNDASLFQIGLNADNDKVELKVLAYQANRASGEALTEALMKEVTQAFKAARPGELQLPEYFEWEARRLVEEFKVKIMGTPVKNKNPNSAQKQVIDRTAERVSLGKLNGVEIKVSTQAVWDIYNHIAAQICDPISKMLTWFEKDKPRIDALIYTGGGTKGAIIRELVEGLLFDGGKGPLANKEALSNGKLDLDLMVARGAAIFGAGKGGVQTFLHDGDGKEMLNVSAADVLPGRVVLAERSEDGQMRYIEVLKIFAPPSTKHTWLNNPQTDPSLVFCLKMTTGYARDCDIFNAPFGVRLPDAILGKPFVGEFEYQGDGKIAFRMHPVCGHYGCSHVKKPQPVFKHSGAFYCVKHKPSNARAVKPQDFPPTILSFEAFARKPGLKGVIDVSNKFLEDYLKPHHDRLEDEEEARQYEAALSEVAKKVQGDIRNRSATVGSIGDSVLYRLLNFAANFEVPIVTANMKEQLTPATVETRVTRKATAPTGAGPSAASSKGKKRTRKETAAAAKAAAAEGAEDEDSPAKTPRRTELDGQEGDDDAAVAVLEAFPS